ncbi:UNVERIFIED_CONTAM: hypothetical protein Slati_3878500 [Sesamum latifolium]|uniref:Retrotransposon gag domain-containing protein n=1 Tax=Sesamum latifolium TaxID=2727402 RepID=A0AAW2TQ01_9LAMI
MQGDALSWYKWMFHNHQLTSWDAFTHALELRFGPSTYDNHQAALFKLHQCGSVADFQAEFEKICNRVLGLTSEAIRNCFVSGLRPKIQRKLVILQPSSISQAIGLAKLLESKAADVRPLRAVPSPASSRAPALFLAPPPPRLRSLSAPYHLWKCRRIWPKDFVSTVITNSDTVMCAKPKSSFCDSEPLEPPDDLPSSTDPQLHLSPPLAHLLPPPDFSPDNLHF